MSFSKFLNLSPHGGGSSREKTSIYDARPHLASGIDIATGINSSLIYCHLAKLKGHMIKAE